MSNTEDREGMITAAFVAVAVSALMLATIAKADDADYLRARAAIAIRASLTKTCGTDAAPGEIQTPKESHDERETVLMFFAPFHCPACDQQQADTNDWKDAPFKLKRGDNNKAPVKLDAYPVTAWKVKDRWWSYEGWYGREHLEKEWKRSHENTKPTNALGIAFSYSKNSLSARTDRLKNFAVSYRGRTTEVQGMTYRQHLMDNRHGFTENELAGLSEHELERLHSACHHYGVNAAWLRSYAERHGW